MNAISVRNLGKKFKLFPSPGKRFLEYLSAGRVMGHTDFWALQDINFDIPAGTALGILGQNGSGKSTLLSILAGVLEPSAGSFEIHGKVSAILELGSGFHPEFSGRNNVYMYGSIMGLSKQEVDERYDEIVRFSELGDFIDQPLRTYSSGMIVRLAFSVAVNVNADILIVDEALAVGDAIFQHRCFRKIREMQESGKTILYVGHDTEAVRNLCTQALLLDGGHIIERGDPNTVVNKYYALIAERERIYSEGNLIEYGEVPGEGYETMYDFVQNLKGANIINSTAAPVQVQTVELQSVPRSVIFAHPPSQISYFVTIVPGTSFSFAIGILPYAWDKITQGVKFDIVVVCNGKSENIFSRVLQPKRNLGERGWHNFIISLERFAGNAIKITFITKGSADDISYCWSSWGWPRLMSFKKINTNLNQIFNDTELLNTTPTETKHNIEYGNKKTKILKIEILNDKQIPSTVFKSGDLATIKIKILFNEDIDSNFTVGCVINNKFGPVYGTNTLWNGLNFGRKKRGDLIVVKFSQKLILGAGIYSITIHTGVAFSDTEVNICHNYDEALLFRVNTSKKMCGCVDLDSHIEYSDEYF